MKRLILLFLCVLFSSLAFPQPFAKWTKTELVLTNGVIQRTIKLPAAEGNFTTISYKPVTGNFNYFLENNTDFQFEVNEIVYSGKSNWNLVDVKSLTDTRMGNGAAVQLLSQDKKVELTLKYLLYPNSPAVRKSLGWQDSYGDWGIDMQKFPNGLKPVFDYIKSLGMKPGLWVSIGSAAPSSKVYKAHPEWFVIDKNGNPTSLHAPDDKGKFTACFGTGWYDYIKNILLKLSVDYGLEYFKLDFAVVTSAYTYDHTQSGCYSTSHPGHKDHNESLFTNFERLWQLFDELHAAKPNLFIDCTFETIGGTQLIDYALVKHAEGDWLSNFAGIAGEKTDIRIRNMAWWRSPAMPATALVIGNPQMQDKEWEMHIKSIAGALPIMLGDPRKLSAEDLKKYRGYADWLQLMESKYGIMSYRQDLPGFGEPMEGMWDGYQRINTETKNGGIIGVFRHGAVEANRIVTVKYLDPIKTYSVKSMNGKIITTLTGGELKTKGFDLTLSGLYSGELFEVSVKY